MSDAPDDLEKLLAEVRKTIAENKQFLEKLGDEATEANPENDPEIVTDEHEYEEL